MIRGRIASWTALALVLFCLPSLRAQLSLPPEVSRYGTPNQIVVNGKIVSMDDPGYNTSPGRIYQAMAIKGTRIMALGTNQQIRAMADASTKVLDVGGLTVIPGIIDTHAHLFGNDQVARQIGIRVPDKGISLNVRAGKDMEATRMVIENAIKDAVTKLQPGDWINMGVQANPAEDVTASRVAAWVSRGELEPRERLSRVAPNNPVKVQAGTRATLNSAAWELASKLLPGFTEYEDEEIPDVPDASGKGIVAVGAMTAITWDIFYRNQPLSLVSEMIRRDWEMAAAHGVTAFGSRVHNPRIMDAVTELNREGQAPIRFMILMETHRRPGDPQAIRQLYRMTGNMTGVGDDMMWIGGVASELWDSSFPQVCLGKDLEAPPQIKIREKCPEPGEMYWDTIQHALEAGWRTAGVHGVGSDGVRRYIQVIEAAMQSANISVEEIRSRRLTTEHAEALGNIPDVIAKLKEYGVIVSANPPRLWRERDYMDDYGPAARPFMQPVKSWLDQGVNVVGQFEGYRGIGANLDTYISRFVNGHEVLPDQKLDRVTVLKMWTTWAPRYMLKEEDLGTLEAGKLADFVVLDKDYFTITTQEIHKIRPQMTVVGGMVRHLESGLAAKLAMPPVGYQFPANYEPWERQAGPAPEP
ncbi:MAG: amidohydrolase family protein [Acidobacteria bacterium]|nr:amidohydrolase family protein [Acidobacteriota bacterium]